MRHPALYIIAALILSAIAMSLSNLVVYMCYGFTISPQYNAIAFICIFFASFVWNWIPNQIATAVIIITITAFTLFTNDPGLSPQGLFNVWALTTGVLASVRFAFWIHE